MAFTIGPKRAGTAAGMLLAGLASAQAQALPGGTDAGAISQSTQQIQRDALTPPRVPGAAAGVVSPEVGQPIVFPPGGPTFILKSVVFTPSSLLPQADLDAIAAAHVGKAVDLAALQGIANSVNTLYAERGFVTASAVLPPQDLATGTLQVALIEGKVGQVTANGRQTIDQTFLTRALPLDAGTVVDAPKLTGAVDRFNRTSTAQMQASLQPGSQFGLTDIALSVSEPRRNTLQVFGDNLGVDSVGKYEGGVLFQHYGLLGYDDRFTLYGLVAEGNLFGNASFNMAVTPYGTRAGVSYSRSAIEIIDGPFEAIEVEGDSETFALNFSHPLYNAGPFILLGNAAASLGRSSTDQSSVTITDDETRKGTVGLTASYFGPTFSLTLSPSISLAHADLKIVDSEIDFTLFQLSGNASLKLDERTLLVARGYAQASNQSLLPGSDLFQIGGPATVRGYPTSAVSGDSGYYANLELYHSLDRFIEGLEGFAFVDNGTTFADFPSHVTLTSAGLGANYNWNDRLRAEVSVGIPLARDEVPDQGDATFYARLVATIL